MSWCKNWYSIFLSILLFKFGALAEFKSTAGGVLQKQFSSRDYGLHPRNFDICQNSKGIIFFGNAYGALEYDGKNWKTIPLPSGNSALALATLNDDSIAVGAYNEFGFLILNETGTYSFRSILSLLPTSQANKTIGGVYQCIPWNKGMIFYSMSALYFYKDGKIEIIEAAQNTLFQYAAKLGSTLLVHNSENGLLELRYGKLIPFHKEFFLKGKDIVSIAELGNQIWVLEKNSLNILDETGYRRIKSSIDLPQGNSLFSYLQPLSKNRVAVSTENNGVFVFNDKGNLLMHLNNKNGLQGNSIHKMLQDGAGNLWLAMDNGIACLEINSPFRFAGLHSGIQGMGYAALTYNGFLYLGTSQGLYYTEESQLNFRRVENIDGQIWNLKILGKSLICCQNDGVFEIQGNVARRIEPERKGIGHWMFLPLSKTPNLALKGTYEGIELYSYQSGRWRFLKKMTGFSESARIMIEDAEGVVWVCHGNKGVYKISLSEDKMNILSVENFSVKNGFRSDYFYDVSLIDRKVVLSGHGYYTPDDSKQKCIPYKELSGLQKRGLISNKLIQWEDGKVWLFSGKNLFMLERKSGEFVVSSKSFSKIAGEFVGSYECIAPFQQNYIAGSQEGFVIIDPSMFDIQRELFSCSLRKIQANDSLISLKNNKPLNYSFRNIHIEFISPYFSAYDPVMYQYALVRSSKDTAWSNWSSATYADYLELKEGEYSFLVRAKLASSDNVGEISYFNFSISPPWFRSIWAYWFYSTILLGIMIMVRRYYQLKLKREKQRLENEKIVALEEQQEVFTAEKIAKEKELVELRNKQLEAEMLVKNTELASVATALTQKNELLFSLKEKLESLDSEKPEKEVVLKDIIKSIDLDLDFNDDWSQFQKHFDEVHANFLHKLRTKYPKLKPTWLLLCAYVRLNKSNKEISSLLNISVSAVEKRKYRLKEKLELSQEDNLQDFIHRI